MKIFFKSYIWFLQRLTRIPRSKFPLKEMFPTYSLLINLMLVNYIYIKYKTITDSLRGIKTCCLWRTKIDEGDVTFSQDILNHLQPLYIMARGRQHFNVLFSHRYPHHFISFSGLTVKHCAYYMLTAAEANTRSCTGTYTTYTEAWRPNLCGMRPSVYITQTTMSMLNAH